MPSALEMPPPPPSQVGQPGSPSGPPTLAGMAGGAPPGGPGGGDQSIQIVTQHLMEAEQALQAAARIKPELSAIVDKFVNEVKPRAGQILFGGGGGAGPPGAQPGVGAPGLPLAIGGLLASGTSPGMSMRP